MRRLSRPQSSDSFPELPGQRCPSPVRQAGPGDPAACTSPTSATSSVLYRSFFAQECEAVVFQLSNAAEGVRRPRCALTIQEETLTPLEPPCSFLGSPDGGSPPRPALESASAGLGPPGPFSAAPCCEQSAGSAAASPGLVAQQAAIFPVSDLGGPSSWPELGKDSPPASGIGVTFERNSSGGSTNATYICSGSLSPGEKKASGAMPAQPVVEVCERMLPLVTSTPLTAPPLSKDAHPTTLSTEGSQKLEGSPQKLLVDPQRETGLQFTFTHSYGSLPTATRNGADRAPRVSCKAPLAKRSLSLRAPRTLRARGTPGMGDLLKGAGAVRKIPQPTGRYNFQNLVMPPNSLGSAVQRQPIAQKLLSDEITKTDLMELPCNKKPPISTQPPSKLAGRSGVPGSLACLGLKLHSASRDCNISGTRLPVFTGNKITAKTAGQKRPWENLSDKATLSPLKQPFPKRSRQCKSQKEKPMCSNLTIVGQTPSAAQEKELTAPCSQCQLLAEENQRLKSLLETCQKTIAFLEGKQSAVEKENCPLPTEAR